MNDAVGGLGGLYDKVVENASANIIAGNYEGSVLTFKSKQAIIWALILKFGNLALVVMVCSSLSSECQELLTKISRTLRSGKSRSRPR